MLRIAFVEWPESLLTGDYPVGSDERLRHRRESGYPDSRTNCRLEAGYRDSDVFSQDEANVSLRDHEKGLGGLIDLNLPAIISPGLCGTENGSPTKHSCLRAERFVPCTGNSIFQMSRDGLKANGTQAIVRALSVAEVLGIKVGVLVCTEAMFNERARAYGRQGASLIVIPRASGREIESWKIAGAMASIVSGAYVAVRTGLAFQKRYAVWWRRLRLCTAWKFARGHHEANPMQTLELDPTKVRSAQQDIRATYPNLVERLLETVCFWRRSSQRKVRLG